MVRSWRITMHEARRSAGLRGSHFHHVHRYTTDGPGRPRARQGRADDVAARARRAHHARTRWPAALPRPAAPRSGGSPTTNAAQVLAELTAYRDTQGPNRQQVLDSYLAYDVAAKLAGTGSVGARNYAVLCVGNGVDDPLILQVKEALPSWYHGPVARAARRAVEARQPAGRHEGQHRMQTWRTDPVLGWTTAFDRPFYVRQLSDHKAAIDPADLRRTAIIEYARVCGEVFAKAHARTRRRRGAVRLRRRGREARRSRSPRSAITRRPGHQGTGTWWSPRSGAASCEVATAG